jgi:hypothetical protein
MNITYTYQIVNVDEQARCMEVVYASEGRQTMHIGARLPYEGEQLEDVIKVFAPVRLWEEAEMSVIVPEVGLSGEIVLVPQEVVSVPEELMLPPDQPMQTGAQDL